MLLGWRYPDANPSRETRYQDIRLYGRALTAEEVERLPFEDYVAEVTAKPAGQMEQRRSSGSERILLRHMSIRLPRELPRRLPNWMRSWSSSLKAAT